ncbi:hypothetical protein AVEN_234103-1 [Araneus ventricosus]|uniref:Uncharacterized protein n=1 Tax=Araneus ventricosus TaxID=182803 RepID=A0A4Y2GM71_ARAVE|nr:hypothetical protein AVEN_234103-1 [Araneus ventricosus]
MKDSQIKHYQPLKLVANTLERHITGSLTNQIRLLENDSDFMKFSVLSDIGTISLCRAFTIGKFSSEKLLINISFSDQIYQNGNRFSDTDLNNIVSKILDQFTLGSMEGQAENDDFMLLE